LTGADGILAVNEEATEDAINQQGREACHASAIRIPAGGGRLV
jgi:hypothetical protein